MFFGLFILGNRTLPRTLLCVELYVKTPDWHLQATSHKLTREGELENEGDRERERERETERAIEREELCLESKDLPLSRPSESSRSRLLP